MALERTHGGLWQELKASESRMRPHLVNYDADLERIAGGSYGESRVENDPENHWQEWLAIFLPQLVYHDPVCSVSTDRIEWAPERSKALEFALNDWARLTHLRADVERCAVDFAVRWACGIVSVEPIAGAHHTGDPRYMPIFNRLSPKDLRWDSTVKDWRKARWISHRTVYDIDDLIGQARAGKVDWNIEALEWLKANGSSDERREDRASFPQVERNQVAIWQVWVRDDTVDDAPSRKDGFNGTWYWVLEQGEPDGASLGWVRPPAPAFVPPTGPYAIQGAFLLGDLVAPLSPLVGTAGQAMWLNRISKAIMRGFESYRRGIATNSQKTADELEKNEDLDIVSADGVDVRAAIQTWEIGGVTQQMLLAKDDARQTLDRSSGLHEAQRGNITGQATATEVQAAAQSSGVRQDFLIEKFRDFVTQAFTIAAFYFDLDDDVVIDVGPLPMEVETPQGPSKFVRLTGGIPKGREWSALDHEHLSLRIDPWSMRRNDEQARQARMLLVNEVLDRVATLGPQAIFVDWRWYLEQAAEAAGVRDLDRLIDVDLLYEVASMMLQMQEPVQPQAQPKPQARFSWNAAVPLTGRAQVGGSRSPQPQGRSLPAQRTAKAAKSPVGAK